MLSPAIPCFIFLRTCIGLSHLSLSVSIYPKAYHFPYSLQAGLFSTRSINKSIAWWSPSVSFSYAIHYR
ncbi:hypothetical protein VTL71DRAFT_7467 [Oculimacula yallundae]|uniref:Secreted protein n=1 Tax=Oculimacula yallundae TaxID=86028 RepID=A0ABR4BU87_9HELO